MKLSKTALAIAAVMMMSGCSTLKTHYEEQAFAAHKTPEAKENVAGIDSAKKGEIQKAEQQTFYYYSLSSIESGDLSLEGNRVLHKKVDIEVKDVRLIDALNFLAQEYGFGLIPIVNNQQTLNRKISINAKGVLLANVLRYIETVGNIDLQMKGGTLYVSDLMTLRGSFTRLDMMGDKKSFYETLENNLKKVLVHQKETFYRPPFDDTGKKIAEIKSLLALITSVRSGEGQDATLSNPKPGKDAIKEAAEQLQKKILSGDSDGGVISNDEIFRDFNEIIRQRIKRLALEFAKRDDLLKEGQVRFEPIVMIDKETGSFYIKAEPNLIRQSAPLIENIINSAMATATLKMAIYTVNDSKAREFGLNATKVVQGLYSLSAGGTLDFSDGMLAFQRSHVQKNGDSLDVGVKLLEKIGVLRTETVNTLTLFNGYKTEFKKQYEVGNWVPGDITQQTNTTNGVSTISYSEEKPTFEKEQVGRGLPPE